MTCLKLNKESNIINDFCESCQESVWSLDFDDTHTALGEKGVVEDFGWGFFKRKDFEAKDALENILKNVKILNSKLLKLEKETRKSGNGVYAFCPTIFEGFCKTKQKIIDIENAISNTSLIITFLEGNLKN